MQLQNDKNLSQENFERAEEKLRTATRAVTEAQEKEAGFGLERESLLEQLHDLKTQQANLAMKTEQTEEFQSSLTTQRLEFENTMLRTEIKKLHAKFAEMQKMKNEEFEVATLHQAHESDEALINSKVAWFQTSLLLQQQIESTENELKAQKDMNAELKAKSAKEQQKTQLQQSKLVQSAEIRERLGQSVSNLELQLCNTKMELVNAVDSIGGLEQENKQLKEHYQQLLNGGAPAPAAAEGNFFKKVSMPQMNLSKGAASLKLAAPNMNFSSKRRTPSTNEHSSK